MGSIRHGFLSVAFTLAFATATVGGAQDSFARKELLRADLSGKPDSMEVIVSISEYRPGDELPRHVHHGIEAAYVLEGGTIEPLGKPAIEVPAGSSLMNLRGVPHGFKVVGEKTIKVLTMHVVDRGKPLFDPAEED